MVFMNIETQERIEPTFMMHFWYFFLNEQRWFGVVVCICLVMAVVLCFFFHYHLGLVFKNETTNEEYKRQDFETKLKYQLNTVGKLIKEAEEWNPENK